MTVTHRKRPHQPDEISAINEPGLQIECDSCMCDLTHSVRIKCADPMCETGDGVDICPACFCAGKEFQKHKRGHRYRVVELHSYPIFSADWGADEELLLLESISLLGLGNWGAVAEHVGTRTKQEVEKHYNSIYVDSLSWPLPRMDLKFDIDPGEFQERKRRRIATMNAAGPPPLKVAPVSAPGIHEVTTFLPGRLEFEHELDNDAEDLAKDLEIGICLEYGGDLIPEDENDQDVRARSRWAEEKRAGVTFGSTTPLCGKSLPNGMMNGLVNGHHIVNGDVARSSESQPKAEDNAENGTGDGDNAADEVTQPPPIETKESLVFKLMLLEMYIQRVEKRRESKAIMFDRGLLEYKKMQAAEKKRPKEEKDISHRLRPFAKLQTAADYEVFATDMIYEAMLRKKIQELQHYRRAGLTTAADIDKYEADSIKRAQAKATLSSRDYYSSERLQLRMGGRQSSGPDARRSSLASFGGDSDSRISHDRETPPRLGPSASGTGPPVRKPPAPLNLANSPSLHLLTPAEQTLCSQLRILPKPYLVIKETLVREYARRGGKLRRREARDLVKIDVNKTSRVWDFLVQAGFLKIAPEPSSTSAPDQITAGPSSTPSLSPMKDVQRTNAPQTSILPPTNSSNGVFNSISSSASPVHTRPPN